MLSNHACCPRVMIECNARHCLTLCMSYNCDDVMPHPISSDCMFIPRKIMTCHARRSPTMYVVQGRLWHFKLDIVRLGILSKVNDGVSRPTSSNCVCRTREIMAFHTEVVRPRMLSKGHDSVPCPKLFDRICCPIAMMACHTRCQPTVCAIQETSGHDTPDMV